jgi:hypothetical protein
MLNLLRSGDWLVMVGGLAVVASLFASLWQAKPGEKVIVRSGGSVIAEASLLEDRTIPVKGPLGVSTIMIHDHRVRVASDPSPRQYCVKQGWLSRAGEAAICLPNQVSVEISGAKKIYDSLNY